MDKNLSILFVCVASNLIRLNLRSMIARNSALGKTKLRELLLVNILFNNFFLHIVQNAYSTIFKLLQIKIFAKKIKRQKNGAN